jgi:hypothetical protein
MLPGMTRQQRQGIPLRPDYNALVTRSVAGVSRAAIARAVCKVDQDRDEKSVLRDRWPG